MPGRDSCDVERGGENRGVKRLSFAAVILDKIKSDCSINIFYNLY